MRRHGTPIGILVRCETSPPAGAHGESPSHLKATVHEIARLVYAMLRDGTEYVERSIADFEKAHQDRKIAHIRRQAHAIGCVLVAIPAAATG